MPELPEVEITRLGILKRLKGQRASGATVRETRFRKSAPPDLSARLVGQRLLDIERRGKYLIWRFEHGWIVSHLGMSGVLRVIETDDTPVQKHDHIDIHFGNLSVRYHDPRRFGFLIWLDETEDPYALAELRKLGPEPFSSDFNAQNLKEALSGVTLPIKEALLSGKYVVGVGNIYCSESLFQAGIHPKTAAKRISTHRLGRLVKAVRAVLQRSLEEGGSTLRDFVSAEGEKGYFTLSACVYGKAGEPCVRCGTPIKRIMQAGRATYYCPRCQK